MRLGYCGKQVKSEFKSDCDKYEILEYTDGSFSCSCLAWKFHKGSRIDCKHILELRNQMPTQLIVQKVGEEKPNNYMIESDNIKTINQFGEPKKG